MSEPLNVIGVGTERCRRLRSKEMYTHPESDWDIAQSSSGFYWCVHTQNCLGPDGEIADPENCKPGRGCFEAV